jgi:two-component system cell cycle response regulator CpdR
MTSLAPGIALIVEDDILQRELLTVLLKSENMDVVQCDSVEAAELVLARIGLELSVMVTDVKLAGAKSGLELAEFAGEKFPGLKVIVVSGEEGLEIPHGTCFLKKPWQPLDLLREAIG